MNKNFKKILILSISINFFLVICGGVYFGRRLLINRNKAVGNFSITHNISKSVFDELQTDSDDIVLIGDSLTDLCEWSELFNNTNVKNRGISGDTTNGVLDILDSVVTNKPKQIFLMIGINDLNGKVNIDDIMNNYKKIINYISEKSSKTKIYIQSVLPINNNIFRYNTNNEEIIELNNRIKQLEKNNVVYLDLYSSFLDEEKNLNKELTIDGLHLNSKGYLQWKSLVEVYID